MSILQKYILREWFWTALAVSIVLVIVLLGAYLSDMLKDIAGGRIPAGLLGVQLLLHMPETLGNILPLAGFVAVMWGLGRFYRDQEMAVMRSSGFDWRKLLKPLLSLVIPMAVALLVLGLLIAPTTARMAEDQLEAAFRSAAVWGLQAGKFHVFSDIHFSLQDGIPDFWSADLKEITIPMPGGVIVVPVIGITVKLFLMFCGGKRVDVFLVHREFFKILSLSC